MNMEYQRKYEECKKIVDKYFDKLNILLSDFSDFMNNGNISITILNNIDYLDAVTSYVKKEIDSSQK